MENKLSKYVAGFHKSHGILAFFNDHVREMEICTR